MSIEPEQFAPYVSAHVPSCPKFIITRAVIDSIIEFCTKSWRYHGEVEDIDADKGDPIVVFPASGSNVVVGVFDVRCDGEIVDRRAVKDMPKLYGGNWKSRTGAPECYINKDHGEIRLYPIPDKSYNGAISAMVAYAPKPTVLRVDNIFFDYYMEPINCGAIARLLMQEGKHWYNPALAPSFLQRFYDAVYSARNIVMRDVYQTSPLPTML